MHPEAALVIAFGVAAGSFLAEFGKDAYRGLRAALFAAYGKAKAWANGRGYAPLTMEVAQSEKDVILFIFPPSMSSTTFDQAILKLLEVYPTVDAHPTQGMMAVWLEWDDDKGDWKSQDW